MDLNSLHSSLEKNWVPIAVGAAAISSVTFLNWVKPLPADESLVLSPRELLHEKFAISKIPADLDHIIIGSGSSGLSCAAILARLGRKVLVLEQHEDVCGGGTHMFVEKGYTFDSGLHYTVPWSNKILALTCLAKPRDSVPFDLIGEPNGTVDKVYIVPPEESRTSRNTLAPFCVKFKEEHLAELYRMFPDDRHCIDEFLRLSNNGMAFVKLFMFSRLLPHWLQNVFWSLVPSWYTYPVSLTAKDILPKLTRNKRLIALLTALWIDTGGTPDTATFMLTSAVFRGLAMEGGTYPRGGSEAISRQIVPVIQKYGGKVLIRANVEQILIEGGQAAGVRMTGGTEIRCSRGVVTSVGYVNTLKLLGDQVLQRYGIPRQLPGNVQSSAGYLMCNVGIRAPPADVGITGCNIFHVPVDPSGDAFAALDRFMSNPLGEDVDIPVFITFPSCKDKDGPKNITTCQILALVKYDWFEQYVSRSEDDGNGTPRKSAKKVKTGRTLGYAELKTVWIQKLIRIFLRYFPLAENFIEVTDLSTPLSIEQWLNADKGAAVGLDVTPARFHDPNIRRCLDPVTAVPGLYQTGQDTLVLGVTLSQMTGVITALRMTGFCAGAKILAQSILLGD